MPATIADSPFATSDLSMYSFRIDRAAVH